MSLRAQAWLPVAPLRRYSIGATIFPSFKTAKIGLNYKFGGPVVEEQRTQPSSRKSRSSHWNPESDAPRYWARFNQIVDLSAGLSANRDP
jgi:hypothetical protein